MKRNSLFGLLALLALSVSLAGCEDPVEAESNGGESGGEDVSENVSTGGDDSTSEEETITLTIADEYKVQTVGIGEVIYLNTNWYTFSPSGLPASQRRTTLSIDSGAEYFQEVDGDYEAIAEGTAVFRISSRTDSSVYDTFTVTVITTYFARTDGYSYMDLTHENDETNPSVTSQGVTTDLMIANLASTKWYVETEITFHSFSSSENYPKLGIGSRSTDGSYNRVYYFLNTYTPHAIGKDSWNTVGVCEVSGTDNWAWNQGVTNAVARHADEFYYHSYYITYEQTFKMGMARDGLNYYLYFEGEYVGEFEILESLIPADQDSSILFFQFNSTTTFSNYFATADETYVDNLIGQIEEAKTFTWADD